MFKHIQKKKDLQYLNSQGPLAEFQTLSNYNIATRVWPGHIFCNIWIYMVPTFNGLGHEEKKTKYFWQITHNRLTKKCWFIIKSKGPSLYYRGWSRKWQFSLTLCSENVLMYSSGLEKDKYRFLYTDSKFLCNLKSSSSTSLVFLWKYCLLITLLPNFIVKFLMIFM